MEGALPARARFRTPSIAIGALGAALVVLAVLYEAGRFDRLDRYAVAHWMPGLEPGPDARRWPPIEGLFMPFPRDASWWERLVSLGTYPASAFVSLLVFAGCCALLWRRGDRFAAAVWGGSWIVANAVEVTLKASLSRPALHAPGDDGVVYHLRGFDHAFPSGHTLRAVMVAGLLVYVWRKAAWPAVLWAVAVPVLLVIDAAHVPADVIGGLVLGLLTVVTTWTVAESPRLEARAASRWAWARHAP